MFYGLIVMYFVFEMNIFVVRRTCKAILCLSIQVARYKNKLDEPIEMNIPSYVIRGHFETAGFGDHLLHPNRLTVICTVLLFEILIKCFYKILMWKHKVNHSLLFFHKVYLFLFIC